MFYNYLNRFLVLMLIMLSMFIGISKAYTQTNAISRAHNKTHAAGREHKKAQDSTHANRGSFVPVPFIITDQNLGYGGVLALGYLHADKKSTRKDTPPTITGIAGGGTSTKTWTIALLHSQSFKDDNIRYLGGLFYANVNLDYYQLGNIDLSSHPIGMNIKEWGTLQRLQFRAGKSDFFIGPQYTFLSVETGLNIQGDSSHPKLEPIIDFLDSLDSRQYLSALGIVVDYDTRVNTLSPKKGLYTGLDANYNATWLGASQNFLKGDLYFYAYVPLTKWLYSIYHFDYQFTAGDAPFYMKPFVELRGAPVMKYQGNQTMLGEIQFRGYFTKSLALVVFTGAGKAFDAYADFGAAQWVIDYGAGFRWEIEKIFGLRVGVDFAWTNQKDFGWYIIIGTGL